MNREYASLDSGCSLAAHSLVHGIFIEHLLGAMCCSGCCACVDIQDVVPAFQNQEEKSDKDICLHLRVQKIRTDGHMAIYNMSSQLLSTSMCPTLSGLNHWHVLPCLNFINPLGPISIPF